MFLAKLEGTFIHVTISVDTNTMSMPQVLQPLSIILSLAGYLLSKPVSTPLEPLTIVDVHIVSTISLSAESALAVTLIIHKVAIVGFLPSSVEVVAGTMALA